MRDASDPFRDELRFVAEGHAALRRVATMVASGASAHDVAQAVSREVGVFLGADAVGIVRFADVDAGVVVGAWSRSEQSAIPVGTTFPVEPGTLAAFIRDTRQFRRISDYDRALGTMAAVARDRGWRTAVGAPVVVAGRVWGYVAAATTHDQPLPEGADTRLTQFIELMATAIANADAQTERARLAEEQAALRRVATMVARGAPPGEIFAAVAREIAQVLHVEMLTIDRYEPDNSSTVLASIEDPGFPVGSNWPLDGPSLGARVLATGSPARVDDYDDLDSSAAAAIRAHGVCSTVGVPIIVEGAVWGVVCVGAPSPRRLPADTEQRLVAFTELLATAISNAESHAELLASRVRIVAAADETRKRIERDLHDGAQQRLVAFGLQLRSAQRVVPPSLDEVSRQLARGVRDVAAILEEVREVSRGLYPAVLSDGGLPSAIKALGRRSTVPVELDLRVAGRLSEEVELAAYRVVAEGVANAGKHAQASVVEVDLRTDESGLSVVVRDDGIGGAQTIEGTELFGLRDRVEALGGSLEIVSPVGGGTTLLVQLPLEVGAQGLS
jgi:signal transduction histidine kinase